MSELRCVLLHMPDLIWHLQCYLLLAHLDLLGCGNGHAVLGSV